MSLKQAIVVRAELKMGKGKLAAQAAHASLEAAMKISKSTVDEWRNNGAKKIVVKVSSFEELTALQRMCSAEKVPCALITDAGHTQLQPGTPTCLGIGPAEEQKIDKITGKLKLL